MLQASSIQQSTFSFFSILRKKITSLEIAEFARELSFLLSSGISITNALGMMWEHSDKAEMKKLIYAMKTEIESGKLLSTVLLNHTDHFSNLFIQLILIGERSSSLSTQLNQAADYLEKKLYFKNKLKKSLMYPFIVILFTCFIMSGLLIFIVPKFQTLFKSFNAELPVFTKFIIQLSHYFKYGVIVVLITVVLLISFIYKLKKNNQFHIFDSIVLKIPLINNLLAKYFIARIFHLLAIAYHASIPFPSALLLLSESIKNRIYSKALFSIQVQIQQGVTLNSALKNSNLFPKKISQMIYIGEHSGELLNMFKKISVYYENQMDQQLEQFNKLLEPTLIIILGLSIGFLIIAMYLPIFQIGSLF